MGDKSSSRIARIAPSSGHDRQPVLAARRPADAAERNGIQVIARAASILRALEGEARGLSLGELASRVDLARSTVQRIVKALSEERMLIAARPDGGVTLGPLLVRLAGSVTMNVAQLARPFLESLSHELSETVDLSTINGDDALFIDQVVGSQRLAAVSRIGERFALHAAANGKALLAALAADDPTFLAAYVARVNASGAAVSHDRLSAELRDIFQSLIAFDRDEHTLGVSAVGTWFRDAAGVPYAVSIPVPSVRFGGGSGLIAPLLAIRCEMMAAFASPMEIA